MSNKEITAALVAEIRPQSNPGLQVQMTPTPATTAVSLQGSVVTGSAAVRLQGSVVAGSAQALWDHINNHDNPHKTTAEQVGAVPLRLQDVVELTYADLTIEKLKQSAVYVDSNLESKRVSLGTLKELNTKIVITETMDAIDLTKLTVGDYIGVVIEEN